MPKEYRVSLTKREWEYVASALEEYIDKYGLNSPSIMQMAIDEELEMVECALNAQSVILEKLEQI